MTSLLGTVVNTHKLGSGSYAAVYGALLDTKEIVAVKIGDIALNVCQTTLREALLSKLGFGPSFRGILVNNRNRYIGFATEAARGNLQKWQFHFLTLSAANILYFVKCLSENLINLHRNNIVHCDIKPSNILIYNDGRVGLCDFGLSMKQTEDVKHFDPTFTANFRCPELLMTPSPWTIKKSADIWALGMSLYFFLQPDGICSATRSSEVKTLINSTIPEKYEDCVAYMKTLIKEKSDNSDILVELISCCLRWNPDERPSAEQLYDIVKDYRPVVPDVIINHTPSSNLFCNYRIINNLSTESDQFLSNCITTAKNIYSIVKIPLNEKFLNATIEMFKIFGTNWTCNIRATIASIMTIFMCRAGTVLHLSWCVQIAGCDIKTFEDNFQEALCIAISEPKWCKEIWAS